MENRIITAVFNGFKNIKVSDVWQWDYGQILRIQGLDLPTAVEVDFAIAGASESIARIGTTKDGVTDVVIPDSLIETGKNLVAYIYLRDSESGNTEYQIDMLVTKRAKPEAYDRPEDKELFGQAIEAVNTAADRAEKAGQTAQEAAQKAGLDAEQTAQDRAEVAKAVEDATNIATQAGISAETAEKAKERAETARTGAETAAEKTAEDRTVVEQVKIAVDEAQKAVKVDRTAVEEVKQSVEQLGNEIQGATQAGVQAVDKAKQAAVEEIARTGTVYKTAVEDAGNAAKKVEEAVNQSAQNAASAKVELENTIRASGEIEEALAEAITVSGTAITKMDEAIKNAGTAVEETVAATNETKKATEAAQSAESKLSQSTADAEELKTALDQAVGGVAQDATAEEILKILQKSADYMAQIADSAGKAGSLNGFGLNLLEDGSVSLTYSDPDTGELQDSAIFPKDSTAKRLDKALGEMNEQLKVIALREGGKA